MLAIRLPPDLESRLDALAKATGRTKTYYARQALTEYIGDLEDYYLSAQRIKDLESGQSRTYTLEEVKEQLGLDD